MKQIIFCIIIGLLIALPVYAINTNTALTVPNAMEKVESGKTIIGDWKVTIQEIKSEGLSLQIIGGLLLLILSTIVFAGVVGVMIINLIQFFTNDDTDEKLEKIEDWITDKMIKFPIKIISMLRGAVKKK